MTIVREPEEPHIEREAIQRDISQEFLNMDADAFRDFLRSLREESALSITIDWKDVPTARRLRAFSDDLSAQSHGQKRTATIRATRAERDQELNVFSSDVQWEEVKEK